MLVAIVSGLNMSPVGRLKETWEAIQTKHVQLLKELEECISPEHNYRDYRVLLESLSGKNSGPVIPFMGNFFK